MEDNKIKVRLREIDWGDIVIEDQKRPHIVVQYS